MASLLSGDCFIKGEWNIQWVINGRKIQNPVDS
jgi:hypothetical protein